MKDAKGREVNAKENTLGRWSFWFSFALLGVLRG